ncbi:hypothetical protein E0K83_16850 [Gramella sp. BOM4]|nr:hypothetical protein [Christiangramia bathymodioli]
MAKRFILILMALSLLSCSREDDSRIRSFFVKASVWHQSEQIRVDQNFTVYYFENINVNDGYTAQPGGILIKDETGESFSFDRKFDVVNGKVIIENVPHNIHTVVLDMTNTFRSDIDIVKLGVVAWNAGTENYDKGQGVELTFDISPYTPSTVFQ